MNVKNCRKCGKMFNYITGEAICPQCKDAAEEQFQIVKKYVQDNKQAPINEIVENCGVDAKQIKQWIREERLFFSDDSPVKISCEGCGCQIPTGRFCENCKKETLNNMSNASRRPQTDSAPADDGRRGISMHHTRRF